MMSIARCELHDSVNHLKVDRIILFWVFHESIFASVSFCVCRGVCVCESMCVCVCFIFRFLSFTLVWWLCLCISCVSFTLGVLLHVDGFGTIDHFLSRVCVGVVECLFPCDG